MKKYIYWLFGSLVVALSFSVYYTLRINAELVFWRAVVDEQIRCAEERRSGEPMYFFVGGSSCSFSVIPQLLRSDFGISSVNLGIHAGAGRALQTEMALQLAKKGDIIVLAYETSFWSDEEPFTPTQIGSQLYFLTRSRFGSGTIVKSLGVNPEWSILDFRPGGRQSVVALAKAVAGEDSYRYRISDIGEGGYLTYSKGEHRATPATAPGKPKLSERSKEFLQRLLAYGEQQELEIVITIPWKFVTPEILDSERKVNQALAQELSRFCRVLVDPQNGAYCNPDYPADTLWHLTVEGARARTREIGLEISRLN